MTRKRKTINVEQVRMLGNTYMQYGLGMTPVTETAAEAQAARMAVANLLEIVLSMTGNYKGFSFLEVDHSTSPPTIPDESRRHYH